MELSKLAQQPIVEIRKMQLRNRFAHDFVEQIESSRAIPLSYCSDEYTIIIPDEICSSEPVICIGGFSQGIQAYADELYDLYNAGYVTVYVNPLLGYADGIAEEHMLFQKTHDVPDVVMRKVVAIDAVVHALEATNYHIVGHSQGGMLAAYVAALHPDYMHTLTMVCPEGFQRDQPPLLIATKFAYQAADQAFEITRRVMQGDTQPLEPSGRAGRAFMRNFFQDTLWRMTDEIPEGIQVDLITLLRELKGSEVHVTLLNAHSDRLFTADEYQEYLTRSKEDMTQDSDPFELIDQWTMFARKQAGHTAIGIELPGILRQIIESHSN